MKKILAWMTAASFAIVAEAQTVIPNVFAISPVTPLTSSTAVTSLTGTPNQISVSSSTGAVTLSIPSVFIAPGTGSFAGNLSTSSNLSVTGVIFNGATGQQVFSFSGTSATVAGGLSVNGVGSTVSIKSGSNAKAGTFTLSSGAATVANTSVTANSTIIITVKTVNGTATLQPHVTSTVVGTSFTVAATATDNGIYNYVIIEVN